MLHLYQKNLILGKIENVFIGEPRGFLGVITLKSSLKPIQILDKIIKFDPDI